MRQVREHMRRTKDALQELAPIASAPAKASAACNFGDEEDDNNCIICLDETISVTFRPCSHRVTCAACAQLVVKHKQPCPLCREPVTSMEPLADR